MNRLVMMILIVFLTAFISGCGNCSRSGYGSAVNDGETCKDYEIVNVDTTIEDSVKMEEDREGSTVVLDAKCSNESNVSYPDNMRGFDPASEDDMDDNSMSRYMENYDEEGWD